MLVKEFIQELEKTYKKYFPKSKVFIKFSHNLYSSISIKCCLSDSLEKITYWDNDIFNISFNIDTEQGQFSKDLTLDTEIPTNLKLKNYHKSYFIKPKTRFLCYESKVIPFRKTKGEPKKIINSLDKFFNKLYNSIKEDFENNNITNNFIHLKEKI